MRKILSSVKDDHPHNEKLRISCPCSKEELQHLIDFLYDGNIRCGTEADSKKIIQNLITIFGFSKDLYSICHEEAEAVCSLKIKIEEENLEEISEPFDSAALDDQVSKLDKGNNNLGEYQCYF